MLNLLCVLLPTAAIVAMIVLGKGAARDFGQYFWERHLYELDRDGKGEIEVDQAAPDRRERGAS